MKLSTIAVSALLTVTTSTAFASNAKFEKGNDEIETQVCYTAAKKGISAAKQLIKDNGMNYRTFQTSVMCNGLSITQFASKYAVQRSKGVNEQDQVTVVALSALDRTVESQLCLDAVTLGEREARQKHNLRTTPITCNGKSISSFLKTFKNKKVVSNNDNLDTIAKTDD